MLQSVKHFDTQIYACANSLKQKGSLTQITKVTLAY